MEGQEEIITGPPALCLMCTSILQYVFSCIHFPQWQDYLPHAIGNASLNGCLSHAPESNYQQYDDPISYQSFLAQNKLEQNSFSLSSLYTFAFETSTTSLGVLTSKDSLVMLTLLVITIRQIKAVLLPTFCNIGRTAGRSTPTRVGTEQFRTNHEIWRIRIPTPIPLCGISVWCVVLLGCILVE